MSRPVTLFTGQWADLTLEELAEKCGGWGFDGLELACWGDHFDVAQAVADDDYCSGRREISCCSWVTCSDSTRRWGAEVAVGSAWFSASRDVRRPLTGRGASASA